MNTQQKETPRYYMITISSLNGRRLFYTNDERAFAISQLQDLLSSRSILEAPEPHRRLAAHIDLMAFSIHERDMRCVVFAISLSSLHTFMGALTQRIYQYQSDHRSTKDFLPKPVTMSVRLAGPHHALNTTILIHLRHSDWEFDRYSSIGFFLHDRRGDWMRPWRISRLYNNDPARYLALMSAYTPKNNLQVYKSASALTESLQIAADDQLNPLSVEKANPKLDDQSGSLLHEL